MLSSKFISMYRFPSRSIIILLFVLIGLLLSASPVYSQSVVSMPEFQHSALLSAEDNHIRRSNARKVIGVSTDVLLIALPAAALAGVLIERDWEGLKQGALSGVTELAAVYILKYTVKERRPDRSNYHSFPSGHSATAFATATFLQRRYGWKVGVPAFVLSSYIGWGRIYAKKHHWWDVVTGAAIGAGASLIYTRPFARKHELSIEPFASPSGISISASLNF